MIRVAEGWKDYGIIATGDGMKLERWGKLVLLRPDPQVIWHESFKLSAYKGINAVYKRSSSGGGSWQYKGSVPENFTIGRNGLKFSLKLMGFKHTGLFPEQAVNWDMMQKLIEGEKREIKVLNLFAYTGGATVACAKAGAFVTHVDAAKAMVDRAKENAKLSEIPGDRIRYIVDDCMKFVEREIRRGNHYDAIIMDPPSYGRGPKGEIWKIEDAIHPLIRLCAQLLSDKPLFFLINSYTTGLAPAVLSYMIGTEICSRFGGKAVSEEIGLPVTSTGLILPCGASGRWEAV